MPLLRLGAPLSNLPDPSLQWIEVATTLQIPSFHIVGLPSPEVAEARERIRAAIEASGFEFPRRRVVLNLSPASIRKQGTGLDLAMALAVLAVSAPDLGATPRGAPDAERRYVALGELGLDGTVKASGQLVRALFATCEAGVPFLFIPRASLSAARAHLESIQASGLFAGPPPALLPVSNVTEAWDLLRRTLAPGWCPEEAPPDEVPADAPSRAGTAGRPAHTANPDASLLPLSPALQRALGVAAAGAHHLLLVGPRGTGKSQAMEWLIALQPAPPAEIRLRQALLAELHARGSHLPPLPVRRVSTQARPAALLGTANAQAIRPGEFSLAHGGLLVADELPEWARDSREALREPMERGVITLTRARESLQLPARFTLAANGNLCPCGGWPPQIPVPPEARDRKYARCDCTPRARLQYLARLSGPILDRIDVVLLMSSPPVSGPAAGVFSATPGMLASLRRRVTEARGRARLRWGGIPGQLPAGELERLLEEHPGWNALIREDSSVRSRHKILRLALSLSCWDGAAAPEAAHFNEAACYRPERLGLGS